MSISIGIHRRASSCGTDCIGSLLLRVICDRKSSEVTLPWRLYPEEWDTKKQQVIPDGARPGRKAFLQEVEKELEQTLAYFYKEMARLQSEGTLTAARLVTHYKRERAGCLLKSWTEQLMTELKTEGRERTARAYRTASNRLLRFAGNESLEMKQLTAELLCRFENALRREKRKENTISFYMRMLRAIYNKAVDRNLLQSSGVNPFTRVYTGVAQTPKRALSTGQMRRLTAINWKTGALPLSLRMSCALFLFSFWARGMSFVDMVFLRKTDIQNNCITYRRRKSGSYLQIPLSEELREIITWFAPMTQHSPYLFPLITRPGRNEYQQYTAALRLQNKRLRRLSVSVARQLTIDNGQLTINSFESCQSGRDKRKESKEIVSNLRSGTINCQLSTVNCQLMSSHMARHTWATRAKQELVPLSQISEALGHRSEKTTSIYLDAFDHSVWEEINRKIKSSLKK